MKQLSLFIAIAALINGATVAQALTLDESLDATNLTWTTGLSQWTPQVYSTHDGESAAVSGTIFGSQQSTLQTSVTGPGTLTFWWSNPTAFNRLSFSIDDQTVSSIVFYPTWQQQIIYVPAGAHTLKWTVRDENSDFFDGQRAYLDEVSYVAGSTPALIEEQPRGQSQVPGLDVTYTVGTGGTPPLDYQWQFNGVDIPGATKSSLTISNVQSTSLGNYRVVVTNQYGSLISSNAPLEFGEIAAWGPSPDSSTMVPVGATNIIAIAAGHYYSFALRRDGTLLGWGQNHADRATPPVGLSNVIALALSGHSLALKTDGSLFAWGDGSLNLTNVPPTLTNVVAIAADIFYSLALKSDGTVSAWGYGALTNVPADLSGVTAIAAGQSYALALTQDGTITQWGPGEAVPARPTQVTAIASGVSHALALHEDSTVTAWGDNTYGQTTVPVGLSNVVAIGAGSLHNLALREDGTVVAWEANHVGQSGVPAGLTNVAAIAAGDFHNLALVNGERPVRHAQMTNPKLSSGTFTVSIPSQCGRVYSLQFKDAFGDPWTPLPLVPGTGTNLVLPHTHVPTAQRVYQVQRW